MIALIFGHALPEDEEDARQLEEKQDNEDQKFRNMGIEPKQRPKIQPQPNIVGILQLVNKVDSKITDHDKVSSLVQSNSSVDISKAGRVPSRKGHHECR